MMFERARVVLPSSLMIVSLWVAGCGETPADSSGDEGSAPAAADKPSDPGKQSGSAKPAAPDVPIAPEVIPDSTTKLAWVSYNSPMKPADLAAFYQKEFTAKGWTMGRNDIAPLAMKTLTGAVQEYRKGSDVHTVVLTEQMGSDANYTMVMVMDIPLPPQTTQVVAYGQQAALEMRETPDEAMAFFTKHLSALGWSGPQAPADVGGTKSATFSRDNGARTITLSVRPGGGSKGSSVTLMHVQTA